jgi:uncharacterized protein YraI
MDMIKLLGSLAVAGGLLIAGMMTTPASADERAVTTGAVHLRAGPGVKFKRIATIPGGASLWVDFCQPGWCKVLWRKLEGWVAAGYLDIHYEAPAPAYDSYYYFDYGPDYYYWWPHRPHFPKPPHCKPYHDCKPPPCKGKHCGPGPKPWPKPDKPPKWDNDKPPKWDGGKPPKWKGKWNGDSPKFDGPGGNWPKQSITIERQGQQSGGGGHIERGSGGGDGGGSRGRGRIWLDD